MKNDHSRKTASLRRVREKLAARPRDRARRASADAERGGDDRRLDRRARHDDGVHGRCRHDRRFLARTAIGVRQHIGVQTALNAAVANGPEAFEPQRGALYAGSRPTTQAAAAMAAAVAVAYVETLVPE
jgi:hypothetical protein